MQRPLVPTVLAAALTAAVTTGFALAHDLAAGHNDEVTTATPLPFGVEKSGPVRTPAAVKLAPGTAVSGTGFWRFVAAKDLTPVPPEAMPKIKGAHGTIIVDSERDLVYWGLENVGWVAFSDHLTKSWVVKGDPAFA